jgi:hypothetical protein
MPVGQAAICSCFTPQLMCEREQCWACAVVVLTAKLRGCARPEMRRDVSILGPDATTGLKEDRAFRPIAHHSGLFNMSVRQRVIAAIE